MSKVTPLVILALLLCLVGCERKDRTAAINTVENTLSEATKKINQLAPSKDSLSPSAAAEQLDRFFTYEYRVIPIDKNMSTSQVEGTLTALGRERWDCFHIQSLEDGSRIFCKRLPRPYVEYLMKIL